VIGYVRVSTDEQSLGPDAQRAAIERWAWLCSPSTRIEACPGRQRPGRATGLLAVVGDRAQPGDLPRRGEALARDGIAAQLERLVAYSGATADRAGEDAATRAALKSSAELPSLASYRRRQTLACTARLTSSGSSSRMASVYSQAAFTSPAW